MIKRKEPTSTLHRIVEYNDTIYIAGTTADDVSVGMKQQTEQVLSKIEKFAAQAGSNKDKILSVTIFVTDLSRKSEMDAAWKAWANPAHLPARATIGVSDLGKGTLIEMTAIAAK